MAATVDAGKGPLERGGLDTPLGRVVVVARAGVLVALDFAEHEDAWAARLQRRFPGEPVVAGADPAGAVSALRAYLAGELGALDRIPVDPGGTPFQRAVWLGLRTIAAGTTIPYAELARRVGSPRGFRAVGITNGKNPIAIVLPCHRVIGRDGTLTGYGGGLWRKAWLLRHEGVAVQGELLEG